jgi:hypothetical protein
MQQSLEPGLGAIYKGMLSEIAVLLLRIWHENNIAEIFRGQYSAFHPHTHFIIDNISPVTGDILSMILFPFRS